MKYLIPLLLILSTTISAEPIGSSPGEKCAAVQRAESFRNLGKDELSAKRQEVMQRYGSAIIDEICESSTSLTYNGFKQNLERAKQENQEAGGADYDNAELYFLLVCGVEQVNLSPLAYHAFNLNRDDHGFLGEMTLAIVWMSIGYLDIKDPDHDRSFMDAVKRVLAYAKQQESETEIEMYEDLLLQIDGFKEDYAISVNECRESG